MICFALFLACNSLTSESPDNSTLSANYNIQNIQIMSTYEFGGLGWNYPQTSLLPMAYQSEAEEIQDAIALFQSKKDIELIELLLPYIKKHPKDPVAHSLIGASFFRLKDIEQASMAMKHVVELLPSALSHVNYATTLQFLGHPELAIEQYEAALKFDRKSFLALRNMASLSYTLKNLEQAEFYLGEMIRSNPNDSYPYVALGQVLVEQGKYAEAEAVYRFRLAELEIVSEQESLTAGGLLLDLPLALGRVCLLQNKRGEAEEWLLKTIEYSQKRDGVWTSELTYSIEARRTLSGMAMESGHLGKAEELLRGALNDLDGLVEAEGMPQSDGAILKRQLLDIQETVRRLKAAK